MTRFGISIPLTSSLLFLLACEHTEEIPPDDEFPIQTVFKVDDFEPATECKSCHPTHYREWSGSMHAYAMKDPVWFTSHANEQQHFAVEGDRDLGQFCIMCHSPVAFLTGAIEEPASLTIDDTSSLAPQVREGIGCSFCHATTHMSPTTEVAASGDDFEAIFYFLNAGDVKYGPLQDPIANGAHESQYHPDYDKSEFCRGCHDMTIDGLSAEVTFTEWSGTAFQAMGVECQTCHMQTYSGYAVDRELFPEASLRENLHRHSFAGVDRALTAFRQEDAQLEAIEDLMKVTAELNFQPFLPDTVSSGDTLHISLIVTNIAGHSLPSGVTFARQLWLEVIAVQEGDTLYESGFLNEDLDLYDFYIDPEGMTDPDLTVFRTVLYNAEGDSGLRHVSVERMSRFTDNTIPPQGSKTVRYPVILDDVSEGIMDVNVRLRMRALPPFLLRELGHGEFVPRLTIFDIAALSGSVTVRSGG